ncbi:MAG: hypothetical protein EOO24_29390 [Comamonadaceae bacterium]|nr:MAG: hypothetical protein EOO24_29390 [Comamonadaceae bacterium]
MQSEGRFMSELIPGHAEAMRRAGPAELEAALTRGRLQLLGLFDGFEQALGPAGLRIAQDAVVNLPLWELGHIGWFEAFWIGRNAARDQGPACDPLGPRDACPLLPQADALYDSSNVAHGQRWQLALPDPDATRAYLAAVRERTLALLRTSGSSDDALYFFRLVLFHEDMHREAWHFMAQRLGIDLGPAMTGRAPRPASTRGTWAVPGGLRRMGRDIGHAGCGFAFDNECRAHAEEVPAFIIDRAPVPWSAYLAFVDTAGAAPPRHLRRGADGWERSQFGRWVAVDPAAPALNLTADEAQAWCRWAGRRLPTESEWETAAQLAAAEGESFEWGEVWEWTASRFTPYPGFVPHPYRDYSQPWFDGRPVLRGGSFATTPHMKHPHYRNFFDAGRHDVFAGFRSCAV